MNNLNSILWSHILIYDDYFWHLFKNIITPGEVIRCSGRTYGVVCATVLYLSNLSGKGLNSLCLESAFLSELLHRKEQYTYWKTLKNATFESIPEDQGTIKFMRRPNTMYVQTVFGQFRIKVCLTTISTQLTEQNLNFCLLIWVLIGNLP